MNIKYFQCINSDEIGLKVSKLFVEQVKRNPNSVFILATGSSPLSTYKAICNDYELNKTNWSKAITFNLDEYLALKTNYNDQSYRYFMNTNLFDHINVDKNNTHFPSQDLLGDKYQQLIYSHHQVDIAILGVGNNGHIAFNEPGTPLNSMTHVVDLTESSRQANARFFDNDINNVPTQAITMGLKEILSARKIILIATGKSKKAAIDKLQSAASFDSKWPITALTQHNNVLVYIDGLDK